MRVIVAFESDKQRSQICEALAAGGIPVRYALSSCAETVRWVRQMGGGIVITGYKMGGDTADTLAYQLDGRALILVVAPQPQLDFLDSEDIFTLAVPFTRAELSSSVRMLCQMEEKIWHQTVPRRGAQEKAVVDQAKGVLMARDGLTEAQAHAALQRMSMNTGKKLIDIARDLIETAKDDAP